MDADPLALVMNMIKEDAPHVAEKHRLLLLAGMLAVSCGKLRIPRKEMMDIIEGAYEEGLKMKKEKSLFE